MKKLFVVIVVSLLAGIGYCQVAPANNLFVYLKPVDATGNTMASDALEAHPGNAPFNKISLIVELPSPDNIAKIHVQMGSSPSSSNIADHIFTFDQTSGLPSGYSYSRNGNRVVLEIGTHAGVQHYTASVTLEDSNGVESEAVVKTK